MDTVNMKSISFADLPATLAGQIEDEFMYDLFQGQSGEKQVFIAFNRLRERAVIEGDGKILWVDAASPVDAMAQFA